MKPWVIVSPSGLYYIGMHQEELGVWQIALGWPSNTEIEERKRQGWYAAQATVTWSQ